MSNITKNLLLAFTLVCAIAFIVFCVQLIVINWGVEPESPGTSVSGSGSKAKGGEDPDPNATGEEPNGDPGANGSTTGEDTPAPPTERPPPQGTRHSLLVGDGQRLVVYAREELFDFEEGELDWWFLYSGGGVATLEISFTVVSPQGMAAHAETFLNDYSGKTESEFGGETSIKGSPLKGYYVSASSGGEKWEAWIHTLPDSDLALVFVLNYQNEQQRTALYEILDSLDMDKMA